MTDVPAADEPALRSKALDFTEIHSYICIVKYMHQNDGRQTDMKKDSRAQESALHAEEIAALMQGLADINRLRIVNLLLQREELCVCDIERVLAIPQTRVSRHLSILRHAGLVSSRRAGRWIHYQLERDVKLKTDLFSSLMQVMPSSDVFARDTATLEGTHALACDTTKEAACRPTDRGR